MADSFRLEPPNSLIQQALKEFSDDSRAIRRNYTIKCWNKKKKKKLDSVVSRGGAEQTANVHNLKHAWSSQSKVFDKSVEDYTFPGALTCCSHQQSKVRSFFFCPKSNKLLKSNETPAFGKGKKREKNVFNYIMLDEYMFQIVFSQSGTYKGD